MVAPDESGSPPGLDDAQQLRYSRHLLLNDWDEACQQRLLAAHALVVGAGGLGAPALMYLAAAGVGRITVIDPDEVELSNLQRQVVHQTARIGWPKVASARQALAELNPEVTVQAVHRAADELALDDQRIDHAAAVVDDHVANDAHRECLGIDLDLHGGMAPAVQRLMGRDIGDLHGNSFSSRN